MSLSESISRPISQSVSNQTGRIRLADKSSLDDAFVASSASTGVKERTRRTTSKANQKPNKKKSAEINQIRVQQQPRKERSWPSNSSQLKRRIDRQPKEGRKRRLVSTGVEWVVAADLVGNSVRTAARDPRQGDDGSPMNWNYSAERRRWRRLVTVTVAVI